MPAGTATARLDEPRRLSFSVVWTPPPQKKRFQGNPWPLKFPITPQAWFSGVFGSTLVQTVVAGVVADGLDAPNAQRFDGISFNKKKSKASPQVA
jgi:hypothetical protein